MPVFEILRRFHGDTPSARSKQSYTHDELISCIRTRQSRWHPYIRFSTRTAATFISTKVTLCIHHMAILAGITDALCLQRFHCFVTMMTGNTIVMSISLSEKRWKHALWRASLITSYLLGAVCVQSFELTSLKWIVPIVTGIFSVVSVFCMPRH